MVFMDLACRYITPSLASQSGGTFCTFVNKLLVLTLALGLALSIRDAHAYSLEGPSWSSGSTVTFQLGLGTAPRTLLDGNVSWNVAAAPAFSVWDQLLLRVQFVSVVNPSAPVSSGDGVNAIVFSSTVFGQAFGSGTLAVTYYRYSGSTMSEADILFNTNQNWDSYRGPLRFGTNGYAIGDIRRVLIHELGHALGLAHPDQHGQTVDAIMNSLMSDRETSSPDDTTGVQSIYGAASPVSPKISSLKRLANGHILLQCAGAPNILYTIQFSPDLKTPFSPLAAVTADGVGAFQYDDASVVGATKGFYRLSSP
jgi:hypothetical protein